MTVLQVLGYDLGSGRLVPTLAAVLGLISVIIGGLALARRNAADSGRARAVAALVAGLIGAVVGGLHLANAAGGLGTGNGFAGAIAALVLGASGMVIGGLAITRSRATTSP